MKYLLIFFIFLFLIPSALAQTVSLDVEGKCREFNVTVTLSSFEDACYDIKIDVTTSDGRVGEIFDPRQGWKSSFYYINEDLCVENNESSKTYVLRADTDNPILNFAGFARLGSRDWVLGYSTVSQDCSTVEDLGFSALLLGAAVVILVLLAGVTAYIKVMK